CALPISGDAVSSSSTPLIVISAALIATDERFGASGVDGGITPAMLANCTALEYLVWNTARFVRPTTLPNVQSDFTPISKSLISSSSTSWKGRKSGHIPPPTMQAGSLPPVVSALRNSGALTLTLR